MQLTPRQLAAAQSFLGGSIEFAAAPLMAPGQENANAWAKNLREKGTAAFGPGVNVAHIAAQLRKFGHHEQAQLADDHHAATQAQAAAAKAAAPPPAPMVKMQVTNTTPVPGYVGHFDPSARRKAIMSFATHPGAATLVDAHKVNVPGIDKKEAYKRAESAYEAYHAQQQPQQQPQQAGLTDEQYRAQRLARQDATDQAGRTARANGNSIQVGPPLQSQKPAVNDSGRRPKRTPEQTAAILAKLGVTGYGEPPSQVAVPAATTTPAAASRPEPAPSPQPGAKSAPPIPIDHLSSIQSGDDLHRAIHDPRGEGFGYRGYNPSRTPATIQQLHQSGYPLESIAHHFYAAAGNDRDKAYASYRQALDGYQGAKSTQSAEYAGDFGPQRNAVSQMLDDEYAAEDLMAKPASPRSRALPPRLNRSAGRPSQPVQSQAPAKEYTAEELMAQPVSPRGRVLPPRLNRSAGRPSQPVQSQAPAKEYTAEELMAQPVSPRGRVLPPRMDGKAGRSGQPVQQQPPAKEYSAEDLMASPEKPTTHGRFASLIQAAKQGNLKQHLENGLGNFFQKFDETGHKLLKPILGESGVAPSSFEQARPAVSDRLRASQAKAQQWADYVAGGHPIPAKHAAKVMKLLSTHGHRDAEVDLNRRMNAGGDGVTHFSRAQAEAMNWLLATEFGGRPIAGQASLFGDDIAAVAKPRPASLTNDQKRILAYHTKAIGAEDRDPRNRQIGRGFADTDRVRGLQLGGYNDPTDEHYREMASILSRHENQVPEHHRDHVHAVASQYDGSSVRPTSGDIHMDTINSVGGRPIRLKGVQDKHRAAIESLKESGAKPQLYGGFWNIHHDGADKTKLAAGLGRLYSQGVQAFSRDDQAAINTILEFARIKPSDRQRGFVFGDNEGEVATNAGKKPGWIPPSIEPKKSQGRFGWDEEKHPRVKAAHDKYRPGEFAPKDDDSGEHVADIGGTPVDEQPQQEKKGGIPITLENYGRSDRWYAMATLPDGTDVTRSDPDPKEARKLAEETIRKHGHEPMPEGDLTPPEMATDELVDDLGKQGEPKPEAAAHSMTRKAWHDIQKTKPSYDITKANRDYWSDVKSAIADGKEVHDEAREQHDKLFGSKAEEGPASNAQFLTGEAKAKHIASLAAKMKANGFKAASITDVTPDGYGPGESAEEKPKEKDIAHEESMKQQDEAVEKFAGTLKERMEHLASKRLASGELTQAQFDNVAETYGFTKKPEQKTSKPEKAKASPDGVIPGMEPEQPSETPREAAERQQKALDADYEFARQSSVRNAGEDLKGSARHKRNAWRGLEEAENDGTAAEIVTRDNLLKLEPHSLMTEADKNPMTALVGHYALRAFPPKPGFGNEKRRGRVSEEERKKDRRQFVETYKEYKAKVESLAKEESDPIKAVQSLKEWVQAKIHDLRGVAKMGRNDYMAQSGLSGTDRFNSTANSLCDTLNNLSTGRGAPKTSVMGNALKFSQFAKEKYEDSLTRDSIVDHVKEIIEGRSLLKSFGKKGTAKEVFNAADAYVKVAKRTGGRDVSKLTKNPNEAATHILKKFGAKGVQWGNSVTDDERVHHAAKLIESLSDLADVTGLKPEDLGLGGRVGWAIGARGHGTASAHYEPSSGVINLTRKSGVGALAHEWGHAFDHSHTGFKTNTDGGDYMVEHTSPQRFAKDEHGGVKVVNGKAVTENLSEQPLWKAYDNLRKAWAESGFAKRLSGVISQHLHDGILSKSKAQYWGSGREKFARSFERYVQHKLKSDGRENTYLSGLADAGEKSMWPNDDEIAHMAPHFEALLAVYRKQKYGNEKPQEFSRAELFAAIKSLLPGVEFARDIGIPAAPSPAPSAIATVARPSTPVAPVKKPRKASVKPPDFSQPPVHPTQTPEFKSWHHGSQVVHEDGSPKVVYHGSRRADRIAGSGKFDPKRATSGPMSFFTDDPEIAKGYATGKQDTRMEMPDSYAQHFKLRVPGYRKPVDIDRAWHALPHEQRAKISAIAPRIGTDDETGENFEVKPEGHLSGNGGYDHAIKEHRGNALKALVDSWLDSGSLYGQEHRFLDVLKHAGVEGAEHHDPHAEYPAIFPAHLSIKNPLHTTAIPDEIHAALAQASKRQRGKQGSGSDPWDKRYISGNDFMSRLAEDRANNTTHAWTSIPDWVTQTLQRHGYDGIRDNGGKYNQKEHSVWIPFQPHQVKSPFNKTFDPANQKFNFSRGERESIDLLLSISPA